MKENKKMIELEFDKFPKKMDLNFYLTQLHKFRKIMSSTDYVLEQKTKAFEYFLQVYVMTQTINEKQQIFLEQTFDTLNTEWSIRASHELVAPLVKIISQKN